MCIIHSIMFTFCVCSKHIVFAEGWRQRWVPFRCVSFDVCCSTCQIDLSSFRPGGVNIKMFESKIMLVGNILTAAAYFALTAQLLIFAKRFQLLPVYVSLSNTKHPKKKMLFGFLLALAILFPTFISLCGLTHALSVLDILMPDSLALRNAMDTVMLCCAGVSVVTAVVGYKIFPAVLDIVRKFELNSEGNLESAQAYLLEIAEMIKESMMEISDDGRVLRCNEASKFLFHKDLVGTKVTNYIHPDDVQIFNDTVLRVLSSYNHLPSTVEYRVRCNEDTFEHEPNVPISAGPDSRWNIVGAPRVHCDIEAVSVSSSNFGEQTMEDFNRQVMTMAMNNLAQEQAVKAQQQIQDVTYIWVESTMCKGVKLDDSEQFEYDIKLATRNINDRKTLQDC